MNNRDKLNHPEIQEEIEKLVELSKDVDANESAHLSDLAFRVMNVRDHADKLLNQMFDTHQEDIKTWAKPERAKA